MPRTYVPKPPSDRKPARRRGPKPETVELGRRCLELLGQGVGRSVLWESLHVSRKQIDHALWQMGQLEQAAAGEKPGEPVVEKSRRQHRAVHQRPLAPPEGWGWQERAACKGKPLHWFFDPDGRESETEKTIRTDRAKAICAVCPVRIECLDYAMSRPEKDGHWGGMDPDTRAGERHQRMRKASTERAKELAEAS